MDLYSRIPIRFIVLQNVEDDSHYILCYGHHAWCDGVQFLSALSSLSQNKMDMKGAPGVAAWKIALGNLVEPYYRLKRSIDQVCAPFDNNHFVNKSSV